MNPLVSVIINCYNSQQYIREAIESVINQSYQNLEIIIWDNKSNDNTQNIIKTYNDKRIKYFISKKHTNLSTARHNAILSSTGQWFSFLDSDDIWEKEKIFNHIETINNNNDV
ncbi:glycosyltransferase, partial [Pelagibacteraceae bacterium]|nr:glycosyltransferase [Pelagibacteraceae bacterium]